MAPLSTPDVAGASLGTPQDEVESALTDRYQTTVPQPVRRALGLRKRDRIRYAFRANGEVVLERVIANHPERLQPISAELVEQLQDLVGGIEVDLEAALPDDA